MVQEYESAMIRLALLYVPSRAVAEEVVQETWIGVLRGLHGFEGRSTLKTWVFRILVTTAKRRGAREHRSIPFASAWGPADTPPEPAVAPERFQGSSGVQPGHWISFPSAWETLPEERLLSKETRGVIDETIGSLNPAQREVITLRDIEGWSAEDVSAILEVSDANQRVLLHRARSKVRQALERYFWTVEGDS